MEYCQYHPLAPATYFCEACHTSHCDACVDEGDRGLDPVCFSCNRQVDSLGAVNHATPFWRRLEESFRYPLTLHAVVLIIGVAVLSTILVYVPFGFILSLMVSGAFVRYCFGALENTSQGFLKAPDITEAYDGGLMLLLRLLVIFIAMGAALAGAFYAIGPQAASLLGFVMVVCLPAIIIVFAMTDSLTSALNPINVLHLISSIGLPYGLLLGFILIMFSSVGIISAFTGESFSLATTIFQSVVSNYYTLVLFHIMGYMIFQYQGELGFTAREETGEVVAPRTPRDRLAANIDTHLKDGKYNEVVNLLKAALKKYPKDKQFNKQNFEFIYATKRLQGLEDAASAYLEFLINSQEEHQLSLTFRRVQQLIPGFIPSSPVARHRLAKICHDTGDQKSTVKLINGIQKLSPDYQYLPEAFSLMADALEALPNQQEKANQCRAMSKKLSLRRDKSSFGGKKPATKQKSIFSLEDHNKNAINPAVPPGKQIEEAFNEDLSEPKDLPPIEFK